nr:hypothetical protein [Candidatus Sigynarchaeum springense]
MSISNNIDYSPHARADHQDDIMDSQITWSTLRLDGKRIGLFMTIGDNCDNITAKYPYIISDLRSRGANVSEILVTLTAGVLANYDVVWFDEADGGNKVSASELSALDTWIQAGGGVLCLGDESSSPGDDVSSHLGPYWTSFYSDTGVISGSDIKSHAITQGITGIYTTGHTWMPTGDIYATLVLEYGSDEMCAALVDGSGNAVFLCDDDIFVNYASNDNLRFARNIFGWLSYRNVNAPSLSSGAVSPGTGNQNTLFNFTVTYTDIDNNEPVSITAKIRGITYPMQKANATDYVYTDGCVYWYATMLQPGSYVFNFTCDDGSFVRTSTNYDGPSVSYSSASTPYLLNVQVTPTLAGPSQVFNFSASYFDADNNYPAAINVTINSTTTYAMVEVNPLDTIVTDGKSYRYTTTLPVGYHSFRVQCFDGTFSNNSGWITGPTVDPFFTPLTPKAVNFAIFRDQLPWGFNTLAPLLSSMGITYTVFSSASLGVVSLAPFDKVIVESNQPNTFYDKLVLPATRAWLESYVSGGGVFEMHVGHYVNLYEINGLLPGGYRDYEYIYYQMTRNASYYTHPILSGITDSGMDGWTDSSGGYMKNMLNTTQEHVLVYTDGMGSKPTLFTREFGNGLLIYTHLLIEWGYNYNLGQARQLYANLVPYGGMGYVPSNHSMRFTDSIQFKWKSFQPSFGSLNYTWQLSNVPDFSVILDQVTSIPETALYTSVTRDLSTYTGGPYYYRIRPTYGPFTGQWMGVVEFTLVQNYAPPTLTAGQVNPPSGNQSRLYNFTVIYTDSDNNGPYSINASINGVDYPMAKSNLGDNDYTDGVEYTYATYFQPGLVSFQFECSDGKYQVSSSSGSLTVSSNNVAPPTLTGLTLAPKVATNDTVFLLSVIYTDPDNNFPQAINVTINGTVFPLSEVLASDKNAADGKAYSVDFTLPVHGFYQYYLRCWDGGFTTTSPTYTDLEVNPFAYQSRIKRVAIFQDVTGWSNMAQTILSQNGITYSVFTSASFGMDLSSYDKVLVSSNQASAFYTSLTTNATRRWLEAYVYAGGMLELHVANNIAGTVSNLPFGYSSVYTTYNSETINATYASHPVVNDVTDAGLDGWASSAHNRITNLLPTDDVIIYDQAGSYYPRLVLSRRGLGKVILTGLTLEWAAGNSYGSGLVLMRNLLLYSDILGHTAGPIAPADGLTAFNGVFDLAWKGLSYSAKGITYRLQISSDSNFLSLVDEVSGIAEGITNTTHSILLNYTTGTYYWRVRPEYGIQVGQWSIGWRINIIKNDHAPQLLAGMVTPATGDQSTLFDFTVDYVDTDNNAPSFVRIIINGTTYAMSKKVPGDTTYSDGCIYNYSTYLVPGVYSYRFNASDVRFNSVSPVYSLTVTVGSVYAPTLTNVRFTPTTGDQLTLFNFTVTYTDQDNNFPTFVNITINDTTHPMREANPSDVLVNDGKLYYFNTTIPTFGTTTFIIHCADPGNTVDTGLLMGPITDPFAGGYNFTRITSVGVYKGSDPWGGTPIETVLAKYGISALVRDYVSSLLFQQDKIIIASEQSSSDNSDLQSSMSSFDTYVKNGGILEIHASQGSYTAHTYPGGITAARLDANTLAMNGSYFYHPIMKDVSVASISGVSPLAQAYFTNIGAGGKVIVNDTVNGYPRLVIKEYGYGLIILTGIRVERAYVAGYTRLLEQMILYGRRSAAPISPANNSIQFNGNVKFSWKSCGTGQFKYNFQLATDAGFTNIINATNDILETAVITNFTVALATPGTYYWRVLPVLDGMAWNWIKGQYFTLQMNNFVPTLTNDNIAPPYGTPSTYINFSVRYTDADNNAPTTMIVHIGIFTHAMSKVFPADNDYTDGVDYYWRFIYGENNYSVYFEFSDGKTTVTTTPKILRISSRSISLSSPQVTPAYGFSGTPFNFSVVYTDTANLLPDSITININGSTYAMVQANPGDTITNDGKTYFFSTTGLTSFGKYVYTINASAWWMSAVISGVGPEVNPFAGQPRIVLVSPANGTTEFNWNVLYTWDSLEVGVVTTTYRWQLSTSATFASIAREQSNIAETTNTTSLMYFMNVVAGTYYWRVRAEYESVYSTWSYAGIIVIQLNDNAPTLTLMQVTPSLGTTTTTFNFTVRYTDADNNAPTYVNITINGTEHAMLQAYPSDINYMDGKSYYYATTLAVNGKYQFTVRCSDGKYTTTSAVTNAPEVSALGGYPPVNLLEPPDASMLAIGNINFSWTSLGAPIGAVNFTWQLADSSAFSNIVLQQDAIPETPTTTSKVVNVTVASGMYYWRVRAVFNGENGLWSNSRSIIISRQMGLNDTTFSPQMENSGATFTFTTVYYDSYNLLPDAITIAINGSTYPMVELDAGDTDTSDGKSYGYTTSSLVTFGHYWFSINASQGLDTKSTGILAGPEVNPYVGTARITLIAPVNGTTHFNWNVNFSWDSVEAGGVTTTYTWQLSTTAAFSSIARQATGIPEIPGTSNTVQLLNVAAGTYYWRVRPVYQGLYGNWSYTGSLTIVLNNNAPTLSSTQVTPALGNLTTTFNYTVTYTDADNNMPAFISVTINGTTHAMVAAYPSDTNVVDGKLYYYATTLASYGSYQFYVRCGDGRFNSTSSTIGSPYVSPLAFYPPVILVSPADLSEHSAGDITFTWTSLEASIGAVNYTIQFSTSTIFSSIALQVNDIPEAPAYTSALIYVNLTSNIYYWRVQAVYNGFGGAWSGYRSIDLYRNDFDPVLSSPDITPANGNEYMLHNITIIYTDADNNAPLSVSVTIDGVTRAMTKSNVSDVDYINGVMFHYAYYPSAGNHDYSFQCNDSRRVGSLATQQFYVQPNVQIPWMDGLAVTPTLGSNTTLFTFTVTYHDLDGNLPYAINITINGSVFALVEVNPMDQNVVDGKVYRYQTTLPLYGTYTFEAHCYDWPFSNSLGPVSGLVVNPLVGYPVSIAPLSPINGEPREMGSIEFKWTNLNAPFGRVTFILQVSNDSNFTTILKQLSILESQSSTGTSCWVRLEGPAFSAGEYFWRVIPVYQGIQGTPSASGYLNLEPKGTIPSNFWDQWGIIIIIFGSIVAVVVVGASVAASRKKAKAAKIAATKQVPEKARRKAIPEVSMPGLARPLTGEVGAKKASQAAYQDVVGPKTAKELEELRKTESEVSAQLELKTCIVHKGPIQGTNYSCPSCHVFYCLKCARSLATQGEKCWSCGHEIELEAEETVNIPVKYPPKKFFCHACTKYVMVQDPDFKQWPACPTCTQPLAYIKDCPFCSAPISLNRETYTMYNGKLVQCSNCKKNVMI